MKRFFLFCGLLFGASGADFAAAQPSRPPATTQVAPTPAIEDQPIEDKPIEDKPIEKQSIEKQSIEKRSVEDETIPDTLAPESNAASMSGNSVSPTPATGEIQGEATQTGASISSWASPLTTFEPPFMRQALVAGVIVALMCSFLGTYVVLKRIVFVGVALAEISSTGIALGILFGFAPVLGAIVFTLLGVLLVSVRWSPRQVPHDSFIGIVFFLASALSLLFLAHSANGETQMLKLLQGDVLTANALETGEMAVTFAFLALIHVLFAKEFVMVSFDRDVADTLGFRAGAWEFLLFLTLGVTISFSIRTAGVLVTSTLLVIPAATALLLCKHLRGAWILAPLLGVVPVIAGLHFSFVWDLPSSAVIVLMSFLLFLPALMWRLVQQRS